MNAVEKKKAKYFDALSLFYKKARAKARAKNKSKPKTKAKSKTKSKAKRVKKTKAKYEPAKVENSHVNVEDYIIQFRKTIHKLDEDFIAAKHELNTISPRANITLPNPSRFHEYVSVDPIMETTHRVLYNPEALKLLAHARTLQAELAKIKRQGEEILVQSDGDVRVGPNYLREVAAPFADSTVGVVSCFYRAIAAKNFGAEIEAVGAASDFFAGALVADWTEGAAHRRSHSDDGSIGRS